MNKICRATTILLGLGKGAKCNCLRRCGYVDEKGDLYCIKDNVQPPDCGACGEPPDPNTGVCCAPGHGVDGMCFCATGSNKYTDGHICSVGGINACCNDGSCAKSSADCDSYGGVRHYM